MTDMTESTFHIYLKDECLFKDLNRGEFDIIWGRIYKSYWDGLTYSEVIERPSERYIEASF